MSSDNGKLFFYSIIGFFAGLYIFYLGFKNLRKKQLIENTPTSKVRSMAMGQVEAIGIALPFEHPIKSPFTNTPCVYYRWTVEEYRRSKNSSYWAEIAKGASKDRFYLQDDTGKVLIDPEGAEVDIPHDLQTQIKTSTIDAFLNSNKISSKAWFFGRQLRYTEYYITPKETMYVLGYAGKNPLVKSSAKNEELIMIQKGGEVFYISDKPEKNVLSGLNWTSYGFIVGGIGLSLICLAIILGYLRIL